MANTTNKKDILSLLLDDKFKKETEDNLKYIVETDDVKAARDLAKALFDGTREAQDKFKNYPEAFSFYKKAIIKCRFIALPLLDETDILRLLKNYFLWQFRIPSYDLLEKIRQKLITIPVYDDRDKFKDKIKKVILDNNEVIASGADKERVGEWLRDYIGEVGIGETSSLKRRQYLVNLKNKKGLDDEARKRLKVLFDLFEMSMMSSQTPEGFEEHIPIVVNEKSYVFKQGILEPVGATPMAKEEFERIKKAIGPANVETRFIASSVAPHSNAAQPEDARIKELEGMLKEFPANSLEAKAVKEEIEKLSKEK